MTDPIRVLIVDDYEIVRQGLCTLLAGEDDIVVVGEATNGAEGISMIQELGPDVVLMDLVMPDMDGIDAIQTLRRSGTKSHVLMLTSYDADESVRGALKLGAIGYLLKDVPKAELLMAIRAAAKGQPYLHHKAQRSLIQQVVAPDESSFRPALTSREQDVLRLLSQGNSNKSIAQKLGITVGTVKGHVSVILDKLGVEDRTQAALFSVQHGLVDEKK